MLVRIVRSVIGGLWRRILFLRVLHMITLLFGIASAVVACRMDPVPGDPPPPSGPRVEVRADLESAFLEAGTPGTFVLYDVADERIVVVDPDRADRRFLPASTFKIPNSLIAFETGAVEDEHEVLPYGGAPQPFKHWERDMHLRDAIQASSVPVYQEVARRIGLERMQSWVDRLEYGSRSLGAIVDRFWLDGPLEISAMEQVRFLARLAQRQLPASEWSQQLVREILRIEETPGYALFAKTGWAIRKSPEIGWWVGWVERGGRLYCFALNIDMASDEDVRKRIPLGRELLRRLEVLPGG
jgi:beta-lactamase class D